MGVGLGEPVAPGLGVGLGDALGLAGSVGVPSGLGGSVGDPLGPGVWLGLGDPLGVPVGLGVGEGAGLPEGDVTVPSSLVPLAPSSPPAASLSGRGSPLSPEGRSSAFVAPRRVATAGPPALVPSPPTARLDAVAEALAVGSRGTDVAAASVGSGSSSRSGCARIRSTSAAESTCTGSSATTWRTAPTEASPTPAAPAVTAAQAARGIHRGVMSHIVPLWTANAGLRGQVSPGCPAERRAGRALPWCTCRDFW
jgi:hypothetical protein